MLSQLGVYSVDLLQIILSPEYGAEALKVGAVYLVFRKDIKALGQKVIQLAESHGTRLDKIENHLGLNNSPDGTEGE